MINRRNIDLCNGPVLKSILLYTLPIILTGLLQLLFNAADLVVVGRYCGSLSVAAIGATSTAIHLLVNLFMGLSVGAGVLVAQAWGARDESMVHAVVHTAIPAALAGGGCIATAGLLGTDWILEMLNVPADVLGLSALYMRIYLSGSIFSLVYNFCAAILRAVGDTQRPLVYLTLSGAVNVLLNLLFVCVFHMGVAGVAAATILSQALSALLTLLALSQRTDACRLCLSKIRVDTVQLKKMLRIGIPAGIQSITFQVSNLIIQSSLNSFGSAVMAGSSASGNIEGFVNITMTSFQQAAMNFTAQNYGAGQYRRVRKIFLLCMASTIAVSVSLSTLVLLFGEKLLGIYIVDSAAAVGYGMLRMWFILRFLFLCGVVDICTGCLRELGYSMMPMFISILGVCGVRICWIFTVFQIPRFHTLSCIFIVYPLSYLLTAVLLCIWTGTALYRIGAGNDLMQAGPS